MWGATLSLLLEAIAQTTVVLSTGWMDGGIVPGGGGPNGGYYSGPAKRPENSWLSSWNRQVVEPPMTPPGMPSPGAQGMGRHGPGLFDNDLGPVDYGEQGEGGSGSAISLGRGSDDSHHQSLSPDLNLNPYRNEYPGYVPPSRFQVSLLKTIAIAVACGMRLYLTSPYLKERTLLLISGTAFVVLHVFGLY